MFSILTFVVPSKRSLDSGEELAQGDSWVTSRCGLQWHLSWPFSISILSRTRMGSQSYRMANSTLGLLGMYYVALRLILSVLIQRSNAVIRSPSNVLLLLGRVSMKLWFSRPHRSCDTCQNLIRSGVGVSHNSCVNHANRSYNIRFATYGTRPMEVLADPWECII